MLPKRNEPMQKYKIGGFGEFLPNVGRRIWHLDGTQTIAWFSQNPTDRIPPDLPHEVIFGHPNDPDHWMIIRTPSGMPGNRTRWINEQSPTSCIQR